MEIKRLRTLPIELFKAINNINQSFMKDIFTQLDLITSLLNITRLQVWWQHYDSFRSENVESNLLKTIWFAYKEYCSRK